MIVLYKLFPRSGDGLAGNEKGIMVQEWFLPLDCFNKPLMYLGDGGFGGKEGGGVFVQD